MDTHAKNWTKILTEIEDAYWERDAMELGCAGYEKEALRAATKIFTTILFDIVWQRQEDLGTPMEEKTVVAEKIGNTIRELIKESTGMDSTNFYKE